MESRVNYTVIGIFVVVFTVSLVSFGLWLGKHNQDERHYRRYNVFITESVSGLAPEAAVKFHGVDVGKVESIRINPLNSEEVELVLKIKKETPIKTNSSAMLKFYGITGLAFIEITGGSQNAPLLLSDGKSMATIPTSPSLIKRLDESLSNVASKLSASLDRADTLLSDKNVENISKSLEHLSALSAQMEGYQSQIKTLLEQGIALEHNASASLEAIKGAASSAKTASEGINTLTQTKIVKTLESLEATSKESRSLIRHIETSLNRGDYDLRSLAQPSADELNVMLEHTRTLSIEAEQTLKSLRESPSDLLFKKTSPKPGPGE